MRDVAGAGMNWLLFSRKPAIDFIAERECDGIIARRTRRAQRASSCAEKLSAVSLRGMAHVVSRRPLSITHISSFGRGLFDGVKEARK